MSQVRLTAEPRTEFGKGGARRTRRAGKVPAVLYGHGTDPQHISLDAHDFERALHTEAGANVLLDLQLDSGTELALPKSVQRDPVRGVIEHVDLLLVRRGERTTVEVPVHIIGDVAPGGLLEQQLTTLTVIAEATHIPNSFDVDIAALAIGGSIHAGDVPLPEGTELAGDPEAVVVHILGAPSEAELEADLAASEAETGAGAISGGESADDGSDADAAAEPADA